MDSVAERRLASNMELWFGLLGLSGLGFTYLGHRLVGFVLLVLRLGAIFFAATLSVEADSGMSAASGLGAFIVLLLLPPLGLRSLASRKQPTSPGGEIATHAGALPAVRPFLELVGVVGLSGLGWLLAGRWAIGLTLLLVRGFLYVYVFVFAMASTHYAIDCECDTSILDITLRVMVLWFAVQWFALPLVSLLLLRSAQNTALAKEATAAI